MTTARTRQIRKDRTYTEEQLKFIQLNSEGYTVKGMAELLGLKKTVVYWIGYQYRLKFMGAYKTRQTRKAEKKVEAKVVKFERPPAVYSNHSPYSIASDYLLGK